MTLHLKREYNLKKVQSNKKSSLTLSRSRHHKLYDKTKANQKVARAPLQFETHIICIKKQAEDRLINRQNDTQGILYCLQDLTTSSQPSTKQLCSKPAGCQHKQKGAVQASASLLLLEQEQVLQLLPSNIAAFI